MINIGLKDLKIPKSIPPKETSLPLKAKQRVLAALSNVKTMVHNIDSNNKISSSLETAGLLKPRPAAKDTSTTLLRADKVSSLHRMHSFLEMDVGDEDVLKLKLYDHRCLAYLNILASKD